MKPANAVADANAVIGLAKGGVFAQLSLLFPILLVPSQVTEEVVVRGRGRPGSAELAQALGAWTAEVAPDLSVLQPVSPRLSMADREVLAAAIGEGSDYIITDDRDLRRE